MGNPTVKELYLEARNRLRGADIHNADFVARQLIKNILSVSETDMLASGDQDVAADQQQAIEQALRRCLAGEPLGRVLGRSEFWSLPFIVTPDVLDPRPDTETIIDAALKRFSGKTPERILDFGTGTGCILISLLTEFPDASGTGVDISDKALEVARQNAEMNHVGGRGEFIKSDWGESVDGKFDLIVSNPPYISNQEMTNLSPEVKNFDPNLALQGGKDGLDCYRIIITETKRLLNRDGAAFFEVGFSQAKDVTRLVEESNLFVNRVHPDMAGIPRVVEISFGEK